MCQNDSVCLYANQNGTKIDCACAHKFTGRFCNEPIVENPCMSNPCNKGKCIQLELGYKCECPKG